MPAKRSIARPPRSAPRAATVEETVDSFLSALVHPRKREIVALREAILAADPGISDGIKWNAPSFRTSEWFATIHLRARDGVQLILHLGAKKSELPPRAFAVDDPAGLLQWLGTDRATIIFRDLDELTARRAALQSLLRAWISHLP